jgi:hypothetical protein
MNIAIKSNKAVVCVSLTVVGLCLLLGCAVPVPKAGMSESVTPAIVSSPGFYEDKSLGFSVKYNPELFSVENELQPGVRLHRESQQKVPSMILLVNDAPEDLPLAEISEKIKQDFSLKYPDSQGFEVVENTMAKLASGVDVNQTLLRWRYQGMVPLSSACVSSYKGDKVIQVITTSVAGQPSSEVLMKMAMALSVSP